MRRTALLVACGALLAACGGDVGADTTLVTTPASSTTSSTSTTPTTTTIIATTTTLSPEEVAAAELEADVQAIKRLWRNYSDSWFGSLDVGYEYMAEHNYPAEECTAEDYSANYEFADGFLEEAIVDAETVERDDGWAIPGGRAHGTIPEGRVYIYSLALTRSAPGFASSDQVVEAHAVVTPKGETYFFYTCGD